MKGELFPWDKVLNKTEPESSSCLYNFFRNFSWIKLEKHRIFLTWLSNINFNFIYFFKKSFFVTINFIHESWVFQIVVRLIYVQSSSTVIKVILHKWWNRELTLKCKLKCYLNPWITHWALALVKGIRKPHEVKKSSFDLGGNRTHDPRIRSTVTLPTELRGRTEKVGDDGDGESRRRESKGTYECCAA